MYKILIEKLNKNPSFEEEVAEYKKETKYAYHNQTSSFPVEYYEEKVLQVTLTDEEFKAIKKAVMEVM